MPRDDAIIFADLIGKSWSSGRVPCPNIDAVLGLSATGTPQYETEKRSVLISHGHFGELACFSPEMAFGPRFTQRPRSGGELCMLKLKQPDPDEVVEKASAAHARQ